MSGRTYLDWNATAPLRHEARDAMMGALALANPSSVHAEGRQARAAVERARGQVAAAFGARAQDVVFVSGATEAAATVLGAGWARIFAAPVEHDCVWAHQGPHWQDLPVDAEGRIGPAPDAGSGDLVVVQAANSETGILQDEAVAAGAVEAGAAVLCDAVQLAGKGPLAVGWRPAGFTLLSAHKIGGPKGVGALVVPAGTDPAPMLRGGGQESGWRAGTENVAAIAGFGAAAEAAAADLDSGTPARMENLRNILERAMASAAPDLICVGSSVRRLPNTACVAVPGWKGETQVMQMDLAGIAVSAGAACSSGKVRESRVLRALGYDAETARSAIRVSIGPDTDEDDIGRFVDAWSAAYARFRRRAA